MDWTLPHEHPGQGPDGPPGRPRGPYRRSSGMATGALLLGLVSVALFPLALVALPLGIIALVRIVYSRGHLTGAVQAGLGVAGAVLALVLAASLWPSINEAWREINSRMQMDRIHVALQDYEDEHGAYPQSLSELYPNYIDDLSAFRDAKSDRSPIESAEHIDALTDYEYVARSDCQDLQVMLYRGSLDAPEVLVLLSDGRIKTMSPDLVEAYVEGDPLPSAEQFVAPANSGSG